jgi:quinol-cytochrome oxidoreductase complex cytochrome b subunit
MSVTKVMAILGIIFNVLGVIGAIAADTEGDSEAALGIFFIVVIYDFAFCIVALVQSSNALKNRQN